MNGKKVTLAVIVIAVLAGTVLALPATVQAAAPEQTVSGTRLENLLLRENLALANQEDRLDFSRNVATNTQTWIDGLNSEGKDTTALVNGLAAFNQGIASAQASHDTAAGILASPAGFDANGKVTDNSQALQTISDAGKALRQAHLIITQATLDFRTVVNNYRSANQS